MKLKTECGYQFTSKLESMFTDIKTSRDTMLEFKAQETASTSGSSDLDLSVQVRFPSLHHVFESLVGWFAGHAAVSYRLDKYMLASAH